jgi:hypothetical protein
MLVVHLAYCTRVSFFYAYLNLICLNYLYSHLYNFPLNNLRLCTLIIILYIKIFGKILKLFIELHTVHSVRIWIIPKFIWKRYCGILPFEKTPRYATACIHV